MITPTIAEYLHRNGVILERARRAGQSLTAIERNIVLCAREMAEAKGATKVFINELEMRGERDFKQVLKPIKVRAVFAFYYDPVDEIPATPSYYIRESNHPALPTHGNVGDEDLMKNGIGLPWTPTYETWVARGRKAVRS